MTKTNHLLCLLSRKGNSSDVYIWMLLLLAVKGYAFSPPAQHLLAVPLRSIFSTTKSTFLRRTMSSSSVTSPLSTTTVVPSWLELQQQVGGTAVGRALNDEASLRQAGQGSAHVHNTLRLFQSAASNNNSNNNNLPDITIHRDHAGWCVRARQCVLFLVCATDIRDVSHDLAGSIVLTLSGVRTVKS